MNWILIFTLCLIVGVNCEKSKFIIDNDAGGDDSMAIFMALLYEKYFDGPELIALTTGNGNTEENNVYLNNQKILKVAKRQDVPIYRGSTTSLVKTPMSVYFYGKDGLGDNYFDVYEDFVPASNDSAVNALIGYSKKYQDELVVITIGTLTNIAMAIKTDPDFLGRLKHLYVAAGHIHEELHPNHDLHAKPEFNAFMDTEAYHLVAEAATPDKVTVCPYSQVIAFLSYSKAWRSNVLGSINTDIMRALNKYERVSLQKLKRWELLDPAMIALFLKPDLIVDYKYSKNDIILCGEKRGIITNEFVDKTDANIRVIYSAKRKEYRDFLLQVFNADVV